uniref:Uncharacterized protein n=1 Tax=viral metagenome TaxID=1070528 RepID=A0A6C0H8A7_9ZZZZ
MSIFDIQLQDIYEQLVGLNAFDNISNNTLIKANTSINSYLYVSSTAILNNNVTINSNLNVLGNMIVSNNATINSSLFVSNNSIINNNLICNSNMFVSGNTNIQNNLIVSGNTMLNNTITINSSLNVSGITQLNQGIITNNIGALNNSLSFYANNIYLGTTNSIIYFQGSTTYIASSQLLLFNKIISLNSITTNTGVDIGNDAGIEILGTSGVGYIKTSSDASRFVIQSPLVSAISYIAIQDMDNNINISGSSFFNSVSILSSLTVSGVSTIYNISGLSSLIVNNNSFFNGTISSNGLLNVSGDTIITGNNSILGNINVSNITIFNGPITVLSDLNVLGNVICQGNTTILGVLNVSNNSILQGSTTILSNLNSLGLNIFNGLVSFNSNLYISADSIFNNTVSINSSLYVSGNSIMNNSLSVYSNLNISGPVTINSNITFGSTVNINGSILLPLLHFINNTTAKNNGIPINGFYRTGGIVKVRLNDDPPIITLKGNSTISINYGSVYTELGITVTSPLYTNLYGYIYSIGSGTNNILSNNILVSGTSLLITQTSSLTAGSYLVSYNATDPDGLIGYTTRNLTVTPPPAQPPSGLASVPTTITQYGNVFSPSVPAGVAFVRIQSVSMSYSGSIIAVGICYGENNTTPKINGYGPGAIYIYQIINNVWTQLGNPIVGSVNGDRLEYGKLSYDGLTIVVNRTNNGSTIYNCVEVYNYNGSSWIKKGQTISDNINSWMGTDMYISYDCNIITILYYNDPRVSLGILQVFQYNGTQWNQLGNTFNLLSSTDESGDCSASSTGLINAYSGADSNNNWYIIASIYNSQSSTWIQLGSIITKSRYNLNGQPRRAILSESGNIMLVLSHTSTTIYSFFYNNVDWIIMSSYSVNYRLGVWWQDGSTSSNCMLISGNYDSLSAKQQLYAYKNSQWQFIAYYDDTYTGSNNTSTVCMSGNGNYSICSGSGYNLSPNSVYIRTYKFT